MDYDLFGNPITPQQTIHRVGPVPFREWQLREGDMLYRAGTQHLSTTDLLAHLLRNPAVADRLMSTFSDLAAIKDASIHELMQIDGIGKALAETIIVAFELSRRLNPTHTDRQPKVSNPTEVYRYLKDQFDGLKQEHLKVVLLSTQNHIQHVQTVFVGTLNCSLMHPREIFHSAVKHCAASVILAHNHPSGSFSASKEDIASTKQIIRAGELIQIPVLDHLIIGNDSYCSMKEEGLM